MNSNTVIFVMGDNGTPRPVSYSPFVEGPPVAPGPGTRAKAKGSIWEGGVRVPFAIAGDGVEDRDPLFPGVFSVVDVFATCVKLAGQSVGWLRLQSTWPNHETFSDDPYSVDSRTMLNNAREPIAVRTTVLTERFRGSCDPADMFPIAEHERAVRDAEFKLIRRQNPACPGWVETVDGIEYDHWITHVSQDPFETRVWGIREILPMMSDDLATSPFQAAYEAWLSLRPLIDDPN